MRVQGRRQTWRWGFILCCLFGFGVDEACAQVMGPGVNVEVNSFRPTDKFILGAALGHGFATEPLQVKKFYFKAVPGFYQTRSGRDGSTGESKLDGAMFGGTLLYGFSEHWGISFTGAFEQSTSGSVKSLTVRSGVTAGNGTGTQTPEFGARSNGYILGVAGIYDPFEGENFRLPLTFGLTYAYYSTTAEGDFSTGGQAFHYRESISRNSPGIYAGVAPQWNWGDFRLVPFGVVSESGLFNKQGRGNYNLRNVNTGVNEHIAVRYNEATYFALGMTVKYRPWNLGLSYVRADLFQNNLDTNLYTMTWDRSW